MYSRQSKRLTISVYPDQALCFWLGFLPTGIWVAALAAGVDSWLDTFCGQDQSSVLPVFIKSLFLYGGTAGLFAVALGYFLRNVRQHSANRWLWLSFLIPACTFMLAGIQVEIVNMIECRSMKLEHGFDDTLIAICVYALAALASGLMASCLIGIWKFIQSARQAKATPVLLP